MRWKLLIITSLVAALINAGGTHALVYWMTTDATPLTGQPYLITGLVAIPLLVATLASIFVYRHTARRRKLQAILTAALSIILTVAALVIVAQILPKRPVAARLLPTPETPHNST